MSKEKKVIGQRIDTLCKERNLTLYGLANETGVPLTTLMHIVKGGTENPGIMTIIKLCAGLGMTLVEFFDTPEFLEILEVVAEES